MKFIQFTQPGGTPIWINPDAVACVHVPGVEGVDETMIEFSTNHFAEVTESPEVVLGKLAYSK